MFTKFKFLAVAIGAFANCQAQEQQGVTELAHSLVQLNSTLCAPSIQVNAQTLSNFLNQGEVRVNYNTQSYQVSITNTQELRNLLATSLQYQRQQPLRLPFDLISRQSSFSSRSSSSFSGSYKEVNGQVLENRCESQSSNHTSIKYTIFHVFSGNGCNLEFSVSRS